MSTDPRRYEYAYRKARADLKRKARARGWPCWLCLQPIDYSLDYRDPLAFTADHVEPLARGGALLGVLKPAHRSCNSRRGDGTRTERIPTTRKW